MDQRTVITGEITLHKDVEAMKTVSAQEYEIMQGTKIAWRDARGQIAQQLCTRLAALCSLLVKSNSIFLY